MANDAQIVALDDTDVIILLAQAEVLDASRKAADRAFDDVCDQIRGLLGEAEVGTVGGIEVVSNRWRNRIDVDRKILQSDFPEAWKRAAKAARHRVLDRKVKRKVK
jgi:hypothetical protein